jgi:hypothetical protein
MGPRPTGWTEAEEMNEVTGEAMIGAEGKKAKPRVEGRGLIVWREGRKRSKRWVGGNKRWRLRKETERQASMWLPRETKGMQQPAVDHRSFPLLVPLRIYILIVFLFDIPLSRVSGTILSIVFSFLFSYAIPSRYVHPHLTLLAVISLSFLPCFPIPSSFIIHHLQNDPWK